MIQFCVFSLEYYLKHLYSYNIVHKKLFMLNIYIYNFNSAYYTQTSIILLFPLGHNFVKKSPIG